MKDRVAPRVSLRDVARAAGVHPSTVSRALREDPRLPPATRARIVRLAQGLNYRPDPVLSYFGANRQRSAHAMPFGVALVGTDDATGLTASWSAAAQRAEELGYHVERVALAGKGSLRPLSRVLFRRGIRGILLLPRARAGRTLDFDWGKFSVVLCGAGLAEHPGHCVTYNAFLQAWSAWHMLSAAGFRRIGLVIVDDLESFNDAQMVGASLAAQRQNPLSSEPVHPLTCPPTRPDLVARWFRDEQPDAVIGMHDWVFWQLRDMGVRMPKDAAFVSLHTKPLAARMDEERPIAGFLTLNDAIGRASVELLDQLIKRDERGLPAGSIVTHLNPEWIPGDTLPGVMRPAEAFGLAPCVPPP